MATTSTRRRFLQFVGVGTAGLAGCASFEFDDDETPRNDLSTLIATWRGRDPSDAVTLQWLEDADDHDGVSVELAAGDGSSADARSGVDPFGDSELLRHRAEITDLEPDTSYRIAVDGDETDLSVHTAPDEVDDSLSFAEGGDIGTDDVVPRLHEQAASRDPLFGLVGGDLAYADGYDVEKWVTFLEHWHEHMRSGDRLVPLVAAIGDHELRDREYYGTPEDAPYFYSLFDNVQEDRAYWALDIGDELSILLLDSNHTAEVAGTQTEWFERALAERSDREHLLAAYHVPAFPSAKDLDDEERGSIREHWVPLLEAYDVDVAFEHDDHTYKRTHRLLDGEPDEDGVLYLGDGAWGREAREPYTPAERPCLAVSESALHVIDVELSADGSRRFEAVGPDGEVVDRLEESGTGSQHRFGGEVALERSDVGLVPKTIR
ncbi:metallophosphoesterase family protein [Natronococcus sp. A-GB7]|uniref:purple acid phosphatase family protein n=1 Tax=Natronococcus sp. A-GB7 TaxID=3037649 RepID=UPI00241CBE2E|nr:metallophosphoesterase family protein [Natronococcus sp. A-GB7]MDG5820935.1 metallophosphoesterase family protein [Natronococcus sp. A-GB7]